MLSTKSACRPLRALWLRRPHAAPRGIRFESTSTAANSTSPAIIAALTGGAAGVLGASLYGSYWYRRSGMKVVADTATQTKEYLQQAQNKFKENAPEPDQALSWLRETALSYAGMFPFAKQYVNTAFDDLDSVRAKHKDEVDEMTSKAYEELKTVSQKGVSMQTAQEAWAILEKYMTAISSLAVDAGSDILDNHPELKDKMGQNFDQMKQMADQYGPEAKKMVDETWSQVKELVSSGWSQDTLSKVRKLVDEKTQQLKKFGEEAWQKGLEQVKPYLDRNPQVKELVEDNADALKQGNAGELFAKVKQAVDSGSTSELEEYVKSAVSKAKNESGGIEQLLKGIPGGDQLIPKLTQLSEIAQKHGKEAERILKDTVNDVTQILQKRANEAQDLAKNAEQESKS